MSSMMRTNSYRPRHLLVVFVGLLLLVPGLAVADHDCDGCLGHRRTSWRDFSIYEQVTAEHTHNHASEIIDEQSLHAALVQNTSNSNCYEGNQVWTDSWSGNLKEDSAVLSSETHDGFNDVWTHATGHDWWEDGVHWFVDEQNDWCKNF